MANSSRTILTNIAGSIKTYIDDSTVLYENYTVPPANLEVRQDIKRARIAVYNHNESQIIKVGAEKPSDSRMQIGIDISVVRGYRGDDGSRGELPMLDLKDKIIDWIRNADAHSITNGYMSSIGYDGSQRPERNERFVTMTLQLSGQRDLIQQQSNT